MIFDDCEPIYRCFLFIFLFYSFMFKLAHFYSHVAVNYFLLHVSGQAHLKRTTDPNRDDDV